MKRILKVTIMAAFAAALVVGCKENNGTFEKAGRKMDEATEKAGDKLEKAGEKVEEAAKDAKRKVEDVAD